MISDPSPDISSMVRKKNETVNPLKRTKCLLSQWSSNLSTARKRRQNCPELSFETHGFPIGAGHKKTSSFFWKYSGCRNLKNEEVYQFFTASFCGLSNREMEIIPIRCRDLLLKQFCLEDITPAILIILIAHIVLAVRWMLIKILSAVINHHGRIITVVSGGCHPNNIIRKIDRKIKIMPSFSI